MCAIVGLQTTALSMRQLYSLEKLLVCSQIRGRHATGISWVQEPGTIHTEIVKGDAKEFLSEKPLTTLFTEGQPLSLIGHCRYSTSDLEYNQPIVKNNLAIVHNGVVTQREPEEWPEMFSFPRGSFLTRNDSEIVLLQQAKYKAGFCPEDHPLFALPDASLAVLSLDNKGNVEAYHNKKRPLWMAQPEDTCTFFCSTKDIGRRACFPENELSAAKVGAIYRYLPQTKIIT